MKAAAALLLLGAALAGCDRAPPPAPQANAASAAVSGPVVPPKPQALPTAAEREIGAVLAERGGNGFAACLGCHGPQGEGQAAAGFPRLGGQGFTYLWSQLESYADGRRSNPVMEPIAKAMSAAQRRAAAAHYAALPLPPPARAEPGADADPQVLARGRQLATAGDESRGLQACANCHGPDGAGLGDTIPALAGQHAGYLVAALGAWKSGARRNDGSGQMPQIARALSEDDVRAAATWFASRPVRAAVADVAPKTGDPQR